MQRAHLKNLHPDDHELWLCVEKAVWRLALAAKLPLNAVEPTPRKWLKSAQGLCHFAPRNIITISLRTIYYRGKWGERYALHQLLDTIAHEAAHLKAGPHPEHHSSKFFQAFAEMLVLAERLKIRVDIAAFNGKLTP